MNKYTNLSEVSLVDITSLESAKETLSFVSAFLDSKKQSEKLKSMQLVKQLNAKIKLLEPVTTATTKKVQNEAGEKSSSIDLTSHNDILTPTAITVGALPIGAIFIVQTTNKDKEVIYTRAVKTTEAYGSSASLAEKTGKRNCGCTLLDARGAKNFSNERNIHAIEANGVIYPVSNGLAYLVVTYLNMFDKINDANSIIDKEKYSELVSFDTCLATIEAMEVAIERFEVQYGSLFANKFPKTWNKVVNLSTAIDKAVTDWDAKVEKFNTIANDTQEDAK
jgi:hypothetical protein